MLLCHSFTSLDFVTVSSLYTFPVLNQYPLTQGRVNDGFQATEANLTDDKKVSGGVSWQRLLERKPGWLTGKQGRDGALVGVVRLWVQSWEGKFDDSGCWWEAGCGGGNTPNSPCVLGPQRTGSELGVRSKREGTLMKTRAS